jgi:hypothetical protein
MGEVVVVVTITNTCFDLYQPGSRSLPLFWHHAHQCGTEIMKGLFR